MPPKKKATTAAKGDVSLWTVVKLREALEERGLDTIGKKADLVARLEFAIEQDAGGESSSKGSKRPKDDEEEKEQNKEADEAAEAEKSKAKSKAKGKKKIKVDDEDAEEEKKDEAAGTTSAARSSTRVKEKKEAEEEQEKSVGNWKQHHGGLHYLNPSTVTHGAIIAGFDMDDTLIETKSGKTFAVSRKDWQWLYPEVPKKLKQLHKEGVKVVIFTNQGGIDGKNGWDQTKYSAITGKIQDLSEELGFPLQAFVATAEDEYRKPSAKMWNEMVAHYNGGIKPDLDNCIYVGDAAGRAAGWAPGRKKDFSCSDRKFAHNIGIKFSTPEEYFKNEASAAFEWDSFDIASLAPSASTDEITEGGVKTLTASGQEIVLFVGFPASGKSTLARRYMVPNGYVHVNRDTLKTPEKCLKTAREAVNSGKSVVVDNTNPDPDVRATYISLGQSAGIPVRCFRFEVEEKLAQHLNMFRERAGISPHVPRIGYAMYKKKFQEPDLAEGFSEIKKIKFVPHFENDDHKNLFHQLA